MNWISVWIGLVLRYNSQLIITPANLKTDPGAHQTEPLSLLISWVNPLTSRVINRTIFFCNALESRECACCLLSFLYFHWFFPLSARETTPGNRFIYKSTRERVDSKGLYGRYRLHLMGSWLNSVVQEVCSILPLCKIVGRWVYFQFW